MKTIYLRSLLIAIIAILALPTTRGATIAYDANKSVGQSKGPSDFSKYGSAGYILAATASVGSASAGGIFTQVDPFSFHGGGYSTSNTLPTNITATSINQNYVSAFGHAWGNPQGRGLTLIGLAGSGTSTDTDEFSITFNTDSTSGYRIAVLTQSNDNGNGVNRVTLYTGGTSVQTAASSASNNLVLTGNTAFYSFDVTNISQGDKVTINLSHPQKGGKLLYYGFTLDALPGTSTASVSLTLAAVSLGFGLASIEFFIAKRRQVRGTDV